VGGIKAKILPKQKSGEKTAAMCPKGGRRENRTSDMRSIPPSTRVDVGKDFVQEEISEENH